MTESGGEKRLEEEEETKGEKKMKFLQTDRRKGQLKVVQEVLATLRRVFCSALCTNGGEDTNNIVGDVIEEDISEVAEEGRKEDTNNTNRDAREISSFRRLVDAGLENLAKILQRRNIL